MKQHMKKIFLILLVIDVLELIMMGINMIPSFKELEAYGQLMMIVTIAITAAAAILVFEIFAKLLLMRSISPEFSWNKKVKRCVSAAKLLVLFNLGTVLISVLSMGGEGATLLNQMSIYLQIAASAVEVITVLFYLRAVKKIF